MSPLYILVAFLVAFRLVELAVSRRNQRLLLANGGMEFGRGHYPLIVALHVAWLLALLLTVPPQVPVRKPLLYLFALLQLGRAWVILTLGPLWTTRVILLPGARRVSSGPLSLSETP